MKGVLTYRKGNKVIDRVIDHLITKEEFLEGVADMIDLSETEPNCYTIIIRLECGEKYGK